MSSPCKVGLAALVALLAAGCPWPWRGPQTPRFDARPTHGVAIGGVTPETAIVWARGERENWMQIAIDPPGEHTRYRTRVLAADDFAASVVITGLAPDTRYEVRVWFSEEVDSPVPAPAEASARFRTAPPPDAARPVRFAFGGDVGGQNVCRDQRDGYPIFRTIAQRQPDFFIGLGDMIYADDMCAARGTFGNEQVPGGFSVSTTVEDYWAHWRYNREDPAFRELLADTPIFGVWDDHETVNDSGPETDTRSEPPFSPDVELMPIALRAFFDHNPVREHPDERRRLYRSVRWGKHVEIFFLDTRQYRDSNALPDTAEAPKTMLGRRQRVWLEDRLTASRATWKVVVSSVPMSIPTGFPPERGRDGWANHGQETGFERELTSLLDLCRRRRVRNLLWLTTDVHFATGFVYRPFPEDPDFVLHELATGPLNADFFPIADVDPTLHPERLFTFAPPGLGAVKTWEEALRWFNFGWISVDEAGKLEWSVVGVDGRDVAGGSLEPR